MITIRLLELTVSMPFRSKIDFGHFLSSHTFKYFLDSDCGDHFDSRLLVQVSFTSILLEVIVV